MSMLNDLMPLEEIVVGDGAGGEGNRWDNPFPHHDLESIGDMLSNPFSAPIGGLPIVGANIVERLNPGNTTLPIKHPKK